MKTIILQDEIINVDYIKWISKVETTGHQFDDTSFIDFIVRIKSGRIYDVWDFFSAFNIYFLDKTEKRIVFKLIDIPLEDRTKLIKEVNALETKEEKMAYFKEVWVTFSKQVEELAKSKRSKLNDMMNDLPPIERL